MQFLSLLSFPPLEDETIFFGSFYEVQIDWQNFVKIMFLITSIMVECDYKPPETVHFLIPFWIPVSVLDAAILRVCFGSSQTDCRQLVSCVK